MGTILQSEKKKDNRKCDTGSTPLLENDKKKRPKCGLAAVKNGKSAKRQARVPEQGHRRRRKKNLPNMICHLTGYLINILFSQGGKRT